MIKTEAPNLGAPWLQHYVPQFEEILRQLELVEGFILVPIETYSPEVARALGAWLERRGRHVSVIEPRDRESWELLAATLLQWSPGDRGTVLVIGREAEQPGEAAGLRLLNQRRDVVTRHLACPLLWCGAPAFHARTWELTPDFWSIRAIGHRLESSGSSPAEHPRTEHIPYDGPTRDLLAREELERLFAAARAQRDVSNTVWVALRLVLVLVGQGDLDHATETVNAARGDLDRSVIETARRVWLSAALTSSLAEIRRRQGELDEALRLLREEVLPVYDSSGSPSLRAATLGRIAEVLQARGELDEALRLLREEVLPVYERLGDEWSRAQALSRIANVLQARGELEEALRLLREEVLPVYERLGDEWWRAQALGRIADVLQARGELEEALRIRREEELPVYARLGDVRLCALTWSQIANVLPVRGNLEEVLRIYHDEVIPPLERLGARYELVTMRISLAACYLHRGAADDGERAAALLRQALTDAEALQHPGAATIRAVMERQGLSHGKSDQE